MSNRKPKSFIIGFAACCEAWLCPAARMASPACARLRRVWNPWSHMNGEAKPRLTTGGEADTVDPPS